MMENSFGGELTEARLTGVLGPYAGQVFRVFAGEAVIGRELGCHVALPEESTVSRRHAVLFQRGSGWVLRDEGSANGTWVNGIPIQEQTLLPGDMVRLGESDFRFEMVSAGGASYAAPPPQPDPAAFEQTQFFSPEAPPPHAPGGYAPPAPGPATIGHPGAPMVGAPHSGTYPSPPPGGYSPSSYAGGPSGLAIGTLVCGILSLLCMCVPFAACVLPLAAFGMGAYELTAIQSGRSSSQGKVFAIVGMALAGIPFLISAGLMVLQLLMRFR